MDAARLGRAWFGTGRATQLTVAVWRLAAVAAGVALVAPVMLVGRRPYGLGRLAERLRAVQDMAVIPDALPDQLSWFRLGVAATVVGGIVIPARGRRLHGVVIAATLVLAVLIRRGADQTDWTSPTGQLTASVVLLGIALVAAALPVRSPR